MTWESRTNTLPEDKPDIVDELREAEREEGAMLEGAMIVGGCSRSLYGRAAQEIERLRRIVGLTNN